MGGKAWLVSDFPEVIELRTVLFSCGGVRLRLLVSFPLKRRPVVTGDLDYSVRCILELTLEQFPGLVGVSVVRKGSWFFGRR